MGTNIRLINILIPLIINVAAIFFLASMLLSCPFVKKLIKYDAGFDSRKLMNYDLIFKNVKRNRNHSFHYLFKDMELIYQGALRSAIIH